MELVAFGGRTPTGLCLCPGVGPRREFVLNITYVTIPGLTGTPRRLIGVNGSVPGPAVVATEGEWLVITVYNSLDVGTTLHWHGQLQVGTPQMDGVTGTTQCAIAAGSSVVYGFRASVAGTYCALVVWDVGCAGPAARGRGGRAPVAGRRPDPTSPIRNPAHAWLFRVPRPYERTGVSALQ